MHLMASKVHRVLYCQLHPKHQKLTAVRKKLKTKICTSLTTNAHEHKPKGSVKEPNISIYSFFPPITQWCSI